MKLKLSLLPANSEKKKTPKRVLFYSSVKNLDLVLITGFYSTDIKILKDIGLEVRICNSYWSFLRFWEYDFAFIYFWSKGIIPALISKIFFKKVMITGGIDRLDKEYNKNKFDYYIRVIVFKMCIMFSDANIIVSKSDLNNIKKAGISIKNKYYLPHVIDYLKYAYNDNQKKEIITTVVWMEDRENVIRKGVDKLLYVYAQCLKMKSDLSLLIIGSIGEGTDYLKKIAKSLGIENNITFTGRINEEKKISLLKESKFYFQLSLYEGFGIAAIEALAAGNIVFHSGKGGLAEAIGPFGILVEDTDDFGGIASRVHNINLHYNDYDDFIKNGIKHVKNNFAYDVRFKGISEIVKTI